jgi:hypothetical protein
MENGMRIRLPLVLLGMLVASVGAAQERESRFGFTEAFARNWGHHPVRILQPMLDCAGPVHSAEQDCELHIGAPLVDPGIGDFEGIVLEPPSICAGGGATWRTTINAFKKDKRGS